MWIVIKISTLDRTVLPPLNLDPSNQMGRTLHLYVLLPRLIHGNQAPTRTLTRTCNRNRARLLNHNYNHNPARAELRNASPQFPHRSTLLALETARVDHMSYSVLKRYQSAHLLLADLVHQVHSDPREKDEVETLTLIPISSMVHRHQRYLHVDHHIWKASEVSSLGHHNNLSRTRLQRPRIPIPIIRVNQPRVQIRTHRHWSFPYRRHDREGEKRSVGSVVRLYMGNLSVPWDTFIT